MRESYGIAAFRSRQQVLALEGALKREGISSVRVVSTPRDVALGCGLSVYFPLEEQERVKRIVYQTRPTNMIGIYRVDRENGRSHLTALATQR